MFPYGVSSYIMLIYAMDEATNVVIGQREQY
ncbi:hypothetical protein DSUL_60196 [Desulfovibrionales bacterium]